MGEDFDFFPVTHSIPSNKALMQEVSNLYDIGRPFDCKLLNIGQNDTFVVRTTAERFVVRVYRSGFRTESDILWEMDLLTHLKNKGGPVSPPLLTRYGNPIHKLQAPEGPRYMAIFPYAKGKSMLLDEKESYIYGSAAAEIHNLSDGFKSPHKRFQLDLKYLIDDPLKAIRPCLKSRTGDYDFLCAFCEGLWERFERLPIKALDWGVCHGDLHGGNAHITDGGKLTFYDFDSGGPGWRAYDLAVFKWEFGDKEQDEKTWRSFLKGYTDRRRIDELEQRAIPLFAAARSIWLMGLNTGNAGDWGYSLVGEQYFNDQLDMLEEWNQEYIGI